MCVILIAKKLINNSAMIPKCYNNLNIYIFLKNTFVLAFVQCQYYF